MSPPSIQPPGAPPALFLVNANSRRGQDARDEAEAALKAAGVRVETRGSGSVSEAENLIRREVQRGAAFIVAGGGDGTLSMCANILAGTETALAALPMGTGNTLARSLALPLDLGEAARALAAGHVARVDVGEVNGRVFVNSVTLGLSGHIAEALDAETKSRLGLLAWPVVGVRALCRRRDMHLRITAPHRTFSVRTRQLVVANGKYIAGPVAASEDASLASGLLEIFALGGPGIGGLAAGAVRWLLHTNQAAPEDCYFRAAEVRVESMRGRIPADVDGEIIGGTPLEIRIRPGALRVIVPPEGPE